MDGKAPRYLDVASVLESEVAALAPNSLLPTEQQLAKRFGVSRVTLRRALDILERNGSVSRQRGRGTIVSPPKITRRFTPLYNFEHDLREQGIAFETRVLAYEPTTTPPEAIRECLKLPPGSTVGFLSLARLVEDRIISHDRRHFPPATALRFDPQLVTGRAVSDVIEGLVGQRVATVDWESEIVSAPREVSAVLGIAPGALIVANSFTYYLESGAPIESGTMSYRVDRCKFTFGGRFNQPVPGAAQAPATANEAVDGR
jgi:GntR family transcriptional regulator